MKAYGSLFAVGRSAMLGGTLVLMGCDTKEKVVEIETPHSSIEVEREKSDDGDTGEVDVDVEKKNGVHIDVPAVNIDVEKKAEGGVDVDVEKK